LFGLFIIVCVHEYIFLDGEIVHDSAALISPVTNAAFYGKGIFTTLAIYDGKAFLWEKHWRRICSNAEKVGIDLFDNSEETVRTALDSILGKNSVINGRARITFFDGSTSKLWTSNAKQKTILLITTGDRPSVTDSVKLTISPYSINSRSPLAGVKSCNYLEKILASDEIKARGFNEAIQVNERGEITSAVMANVFWLSGKVLFTPSLKTGCLGGTTREFILENLEIREVERTMDELLFADAIFLTSAGLGVVPVDVFESRRFERTDHPIFDLLPKIR
jgi:branched-subunit amino acid aminotransferase/4-amino-4-deoxychorismate lyase